MKLKNIVALICSTVLAINFLCISAFASNSSVEPPFELKHFNWYYKSNFQIENEIYVDTEEEVIEHFDTFNLPAVIYSERNNNNDIFMIKNAEIMFDTVPAEYMAHVLVNTKNRYGDLSRYVYYYDTRTTYVVYNDSTFQFFVKSSNSNSVPIFFNKLNGLYDETNKRYTVFTSPYFAYISTSMTQMYDPSVSASTERMTSVESYNADILDVNGNVFFPQKNKINFKVQTFLLHNDVMAVYASVDEGVTEFDGKYTWVIEDIDNSKLLYVHQDYKNTLKSESGETAVVYYKYHYLTSDEPLHSPIKLSDLYGGDNPILQFNTDYNLRLAEWSVGSNGFAEYHPLKEYTAIINFSSYNDYVVEYPENVDKDMFGNIVYNFNGYNGQSTKVDVDFDNAVSEFGNITSAKWSPNLINGLTVVRGLFDDIVSHLGILEVILVILTLGIIGWFLGRSVRK